MKGKMDYKSKKSLIVAITAAVLVVGATIGTVAFIKGNKNSSAAMPEDKTTSVTEQNGSNIDNSSEGNSIENVEIPSIENSDSNASNYGIGANTQNGANTGNINNGSVAANASTTAENSARTGRTATAGANVPNQEYTQTTTVVTEQPWYTKAIGWMPITLATKTTLNDLEINKPELEIEKIAVVNDDETVTTVFRGDIITYKIKIKNVGKIDATSIRIYDNVPEGTVLVDNSIDNNGIISKEGKITWKKDVKTGEEIILSFKVKVLLGEDSEGKEIIQIDNTAKVNGEDTNTTHNPTITFNKEIKVISVSGEELDNRIVTPGTRLRYYINLTNSSEYDGITKVRDTIPEGTSLIKDTISEGGKLGENNEITWPSVTVPAGETAQVYFDVTINNSTRQTVSNVAKIGADKPTQPEDPTNPETPEKPGEPEYTNEVKTPVFLASKKSRVDGQKVRETGEVTYIVTVTNTANSEDELVNSLTGTAKLEDVFWTQDLDKMTFKEGSGELVINKADGTEVSRENKEEDFLSNIEVTLEAGQTATLTYTYIVNAMNLAIPDEGTVTDDIANNLYWAEPKDNDPSRPENPNDTSEYKNPQESDDPTEPTPDPDDEDKPGLIDTVIVTVEEKYKKVEANKIWIDDNNEYGTRPRNIEYTLYQNDEAYIKAEGITYTLAATAENDWKATFTKLKETNPNGEPYRYTVQESEVLNYTTSYSNDGLTVTNKYTNPDVTIEKRVEVVLQTQNGEVTTQDLQENSIVEPGTRLRYTVKVINQTETDGYVNVTDEIPAGTKLYNNVISNNGNFENGIVTWNKVKVPANDIAEVYFDVTVNNNQKKTVENVAKVVIPQIPENPDNPEQTRPDDKEIETNKVKTPVFVASKKSVKDYDATNKAPKMHETNEVTYVVTITNTADPEDELVNSLTGTARLEDVFWTEDLAKMTFKEDSGELVINKADGTEVSRESKNEDFLSNIEVTLEAGQTATLTYTYIINEMETPTKGTNNNIAIEWDEISNNLYWAEAKTGDPSRPENTLDSTDYKNTEDSDDPTPAQEDPKNPNKPGLIDTVIIHVEEEYIDIEATKAWEDYTNRYGKRPNLVKFTLYRNGQTTGIDLYPNEYDWTVRESHLKRLDQNGRPYVYAIKEDAVEGYKQPEELYTIGTDNKVTITNYIGAQFEAHKVSEQNDATLEETDVITYTVTVKNIGYDTGTTTVRDIYRNNDSSKVTFVPGSITIDGTATSNDESYLDRITLTLNPGEMKTITYQYRVNVFDREDLDHDSTNNKYTTSITNDLFWGKNNDNDPVDPNYPTDTPIDTVTVNVEKQFTQITATKIWDDSNNASGKRPASVEFMLMKNGEETGITKTLTLENVSDNDQNKWEILFNELDKYDENGEPYNYTIKEINTDENYHKKEDNTTVTNSLKENISATVITTNVQTTDVPMDVVFVIDISSSMLDSPTDANKITNGKTNRVSDAKAKNMVSAVNTAIKSVMATNTANRVAVQLYNSKTGSGSDYYLMPLSSSYGVRDEYVKFSWSSDYVDKKLDDGTWIKAYDGVLSTTVNNRTGLISEYRDWSDAELVGTYTQAGIQRGEAILTGAGSKMVSGKSYTRVPVLILVTDGDPTHYTQTTVGTTNITIPATMPENKIARVNNTSAEYFYYTMKQLESSKEKISVAYTTNSSIPRTCKLYTIGIGMKGSMAKTLLNPTSNNIANLVNANDVSEDIQNKGKEREKYNNSTKTGSEFYIEQQGRLKSWLQRDKLSNYTDKSFNTSGESLSEMSSAFTEVIQDSQESIQDTTVGNDRKIDLTGLDRNKKFSISISGTDFDGNTININKSFEKFSDALDDSEVKDYIKGSYYIDLSEVKNGTVIITYGKN